MECFGADRTREPCNKPMDAQELQKRIEKLVLEALEKRLGMAPAVPEPAPAAPAPRAAPAEGAPAVHRAIPVPAADSSRPVILTREDLESVRFGGTFLLPPKAILTDLAREFAADRQISLIPAGMKEQSIALGADHGGFDLKENLKSHLQEAGYPVRDFGAFGRDPVDYPDLALAVAMSVARRECFAGVMVDGAGIGSCMVANKVPGIRAACCWDEASARNSREHNFANVLTLGGRMLDAAAACRILQTWLDTPFGEERHARRVKKISAVEAKYLRNLNL